MYYGRTVLLLGRATAYALAEREELIKPYSLASRIPRVTYPTRYMREYRALTLDTRVFN